MSLSEALQFIERFGPVDSSNHHELRTRALQERPDLLDWIDKAIACTLANTLDLAVLQNAATHEHKAHSLPRVDGFTMRTQLDSGGSGDVFLATQHHPPRDVAVKVIRSTNQERSSLFLREAELLAGLAHPNIAQVYLLTQANDGRPCVVMELVKGDGKNLITYNAGRPTTERLQSFLAACAGVNHAHMKGVIHCDIKPPNLLVDEEGTPKIVDFGIARHVKPDVTRTATIRGIAGTLAYMSPEQWNDPGRIDVRTDVYSLGLVLFELLSGKPAFGQGGLVDGSTAWDERRRDLPVADLDRDLRTITLKATRPDPGQRYQSIAALIDDIERDLSSRPVLARKPSLGYRLQKAVLRNRVLSTTVAISLLAVLWLLVARFSALREAERTLDMFDLMATGLELEQVKGLEKSLYPPTPENAQRISDWVDNKAEPMAEKIPLLSQSLDNLVSMPRSASRDMLRERLEVVLKNLKKFSGPTGALRRAKKMLAWSRIVKSKTTQHHAEAWRAACGRARKKWQCDLQPLVGLVPLGEGNKGYEEFLHLRSHKPGHPVPTARSADWRPDAGTGIVFVLLPGGTTVVGAEQGKNDPYACKIEAPVRIVELPAFLLSKYEVTQGQWTRLREHNPSHHQAGQSGVTASHPVERVSWNLADEALRSEGLRLPTEEEWEYACRAGTQTPWFGVSSLKKFYSFGHPLANLADAAVSREGRGWEGALLVREFIGEYDDKFPFHAPVGSFPANRFGIHDMHGNVWEWCDTSNGSSPSGWTTPLKDYERVLRGGCFDYSAIGARSAFRNVVNSTIEFHNIGVRPACDLR